MFEFGDELRKAREFRDISLEDISRITKINVKFLQALEEENFNILPEPYIRAFLKAYATVVEMNVAKVMSEYEAWKKARMQETSPIPPEPSAEKTVLEFEPQIRKWFQKNYRFLFYALSGLILMMVLVFVTVKRPFKGAPKATISTTPAETGIKFTVNALKPIYLMVSIDGGDSLDYYLTAETSRDFLAQNHIWLLTSNAGATEFKLDGKKLNKIADEGWTAQFKVDAKGISKVKTYRPIVKNY
jgi:transcriptional regulator with XRE-family HTH domain